VSDKLNHMLGKLDNLRGQLDAEEKVLEQELLALRMTNPSLSAFEVQFAPSGWFVSKQEGIAQLKTAITELEEAIAEERGNPGFGEMFGKWSEDAYPRYKAAHPGVTYKTQTEHISLEMAINGYTYLIPESPHAVFTPAITPEYSGRTGKLDKFERYAYGAVGQIKLIVYLAYAPEIDTIFWAS